MPSPAKAKGNSFERVVAAHLSKVFGAPFMRVPSSGAYTGGKNAFRKDALDDMQRRLMTGDIVPPEQVGPLKIECKSYKNFPWHAVLQGRCKVLDTWIAQAQDDVIPWLLIFKINNCGEFVVWDTMTLELGIEFSNVLTYGTFRVAPMNGLLEINMHLILSKCTEAKANVMSSSNTSPVSEPRIED